MPPGRLQQSFQAEREAHRRHLGAEGAEQAVVAPAAAHRQRGGPGVGVEDEAVVVGAVPLAPREARVEAVRANSARSIVSSTPGKSAASSSRRAWRPRSRSAASRPQLLRPIRNAVLHDRQQRRAGPPHLAALAPRHRRRERRGILRARREQQTVERPGEAEHHLEPVAACRPWQAPGRAAAPRARRPLAGQAQQLGAELVELPLPPRPLLLVADDVAAVEEAQRQIERRERGASSAGQHRREVGAQGEQLAVAVDEAVELAAASPASGATRRAPGSRGSAGSPRRSRLAISRADQPLLGVAPAAGALEEQGGDAGGQGGGDSHGSILQSGRLARQLERQVAPGHQPELPARPGRPAPRGRRSPPRPGPPRRQQAGRPVRRGRRGRSPPRPGAAASNVERQRIASPRPSEVALTSMSKREGSRSASGRKVTFSMLRGPPAALGVAVEHRHPRAGAVEPRRRRAAGAAGADHRRPPSPRSSGRGRAAGSTTPSGSVASASQTPWLQTSVLAAPIRLDQRALGAADRQRRLLERRGHREAADGEPDRLQPRVLHHLQPEVAEASRRGTAGRPPGCPARGRRRCGCAGRASG